MNCHKPWVLSTKNTSHIPTIRRLSLQTCYGILIANDPAEGMFMTVQQTAKQHTYIHVLRIIAAFFVIFNHSGDYGFYLYTNYDVGSVHFWIYLVFSVFSKISVPLFFMISGALLLNKPHEPLKDLWGKRILKSLIPLITFSLIYYLYTLYWSGEPFRLSVFFRTLYSSDWMYHLWYMYAYIAYLICLPFLRSLVQSLPNKYFYYMIVLALVFNGILPCAEYLLSQGSVSINHYLRPAWLLSNAVLYPCIGYFLQHRLPDCLKKKHFFILWGCNIIGFALSCYLTYFSAKLSGATPKTETFHGCFVLLNCICLFVSAKYVFSKFTTPSWILKILKSNADCTLGIYLMHLLFKDRLFLMRMLEKMRAIGINYLLATMVYCVCIYLICYAITFGISKIPLLRKIVGC